MSMTPLRQAPGTSVAKNMEGLCDLISRLVKEKRALSRML